ncbi:Protein MPE1 [Spathaspora sp. JA1]|nr:Protein MPE1 [Spathaspora sp. JA1]
MSSVIYYKFLHQKNQSVIHFDGTAISIFDLKREIIQANQLGNGLDFNLTIYHSEQPDLEYEFDQDIIQRSSYVLVKRSPVSSNKFNNASRYVTGKPRINRKMPTATASTTTTAAPTTTTNIPDNISEEDRIKLMFENQSNAWAQTQDELAQHKIIHYKPSATANTGKEDAPPPPGYICYRCGKKDHWIKNCPTNNDPNFEGKKIMRTTGIPKSYLKTISKSDVENKPENFTTNENGDVVDNEGNIILITDEGNYAIALADSKTWTSYQEKLAQANKKSQQQFNEKLVRLIEQDNKQEFLDPLIETKKVLEPPIVMTPCCSDISKLGKKLKNFNYNQNSLERLLIENDFHCPNCGKEDTFIDSLIENKELETNLQDYIKSKEAELGKRSLEESSLDDSKRQKVGELPIRPDMFPPIPPPGMMSFPGGLPMGMPPVPPMFMPGMPMPPVPPHMQIPNIPPNNNIQQQPPSK